MDGSKHTVVLVQPPIEDFYLTKKRTIPYGLAAIAACVNRAGFNVEIIDGLATGKSKVIDYPDDFTYLKPYYGRKDLSFFSLFHEFRHFGYSYEHIAYQIKKKKPFIVGISSLFTAYAGTALKVAEFIKKVWPCCRIVMGGHHPTFFPEKTLECEAVDFVIRGEGESAMAALCNSLKNGTSLKNVPGIAFREKAGLYISTPSWETDFNALPFPMTDLIRQDFYQRNNLGSTMVVSSRGCPMKCSYCCVSSSSHYAPFRQRSVDHVTDEIKNILSCQKVGFIDFEDENLCLNKKWFMALFTRVRDLNPKRKIELRAMNGLFPPSVDEDIIALMKEAGFKTLNLSLGSTSREQLSRFKRPDVRTAHEDALRLAREYNLECVSYIIAAAPGQHPEGSLDDLVYLAGKQTLAGMSIFYPAPGSLDYEFCRKTEILPGSFALMRSTALPLDGKTSRRQAITLMRLSRILNFMKSIKDQAGSLPSPLPCKGSPRIEGTDRGRLSTDLLRWFLNDGIIRGIEPDGSVFEHDVDKELTLSFIRRITSLEIMGTKPH